MLGALNDIEVHRQVAKTIVHPERRSKKKAEKAFAIGVITGGERKEVDGYLRGSRKTGRDLAAATPFWR